MGCCQNLRLDFGSFLGQYVQKAWFFFAENEEKNSGLLHVYSVKRCQPIYNYCIYATDCEIWCSLNLRLDLGPFWGSICSKTMIFAKIKEKAGAYYVHSLLKADNLLRLISYIPLIIKWGVAKVWDWILVILGSICPKIMIFAKKEEK